MSAPRDEELEFIDLDEWDETEERVEEVTESVSEPEEVAKSVVPPVMEDELEFVDLDEDDTQVVQAEPVKEQVVKETTVQSETEPVHDEVVESKQSEMKDKILRALTKAKDGIRSATDCMLEKIKQIPFVQDKLQLIKTENNDAESQDETIDERKKKRDAETKRAYQMIAVGCVVIVFLVVGCMIGSSIKKNIEKKRIEEAYADDVHVVEEKTVQSAADQVNSAFAKEERAQERKEDASTEEQELEDKISSVISNMSLEEKIAGLFFVDVDSLSLQKPVTTDDGSLGTSLKAYHVGGLLFSDENIIDQKQFSKLVSLTKQSGEYYTFMGIVDEGGSESPFSKKGLEDEPIADVKEIVETGGFAESYSAGIALGGRARSYGLNLVFGPVSDVTLVSGAVTEKKSFGSNADEVLRYAQNNMKGMQDRNVTSGIRYFPGCGDVRGDGTSGAVSSKRSEDDLKKNEMVIFKSLVRNGANIIQVNAVSYPKIDETEVPACMSEHIVTDILRDELEYDGIIISDDVRKKAITSKFTEEEIAVQCVKAGCDMIMTPGDFAVQYHALMSAVENGVITEKRIEESLYRIFKVKLSNLK